jgi:hypothetical protein
LKCVVKASEFDQGLATAILHRSEISQKLKPYGSPGCQVHQNALYVTFEITWASVVIEHWLRRKKGVPGSLLGILEGLDCGLGSGK